MSFLKQQYNFKTFIIRDYRFLGMRFLRCFIDERGVRRWYFLGIRVAKRNASHKPFQKKDQEWYSVFLRPSVDVSVKKPSRPNTLPKVPKGTFFRFDLERAIQLRPRTERLALVFFMGIGDYFYATPFLEKLKKRFPQLPITAYVSQTMDSNNSPYVADCLRTNPNIDRVEMYSGKADSHWWVNYDYSEVYRLEPETTLVVPLVYEHHKDVLSRDDALCDTFSLPRSTVPFALRVYDHPTSPYVAELLEKIRSYATEHHCRGVVWLQLSSRSSNYTYPNSKELIDRLTALNFVVVAVDPVETREGVFQIDQKRSSIVDSIRLLQLIKENLSTYCITVASCFWSISSALQIPNLGIQFFYDETFSSVYCDNIYVVTHRLYLATPRSQQFLAPPEKYQVSGVNRFYYDPIFLCDCFESMLNALDPS